MGAYEALGHYLVAVPKSGDGGGVVSSSPTGFVYGNSCSTFMKEDDNVTLIADPDDGSIFSGWSGDCSVTGSCIVTMTDERSITAQFTLDDSHSVYLPLEFR